MNQLIDARCQARVRSIAGQIIMNTFVPVLFMIPLLASLAVPMAGATPFRYEVIDSGPGAYGSGMNAAIAVTPDGTAHFACRTPLAGFIRYKPSPEAQVLMYDPGSFTSNLSLAISSEGEPTIAIHNYFNDWNGSAVLQRQSGNSGPLVSVHTVGYFTNWPKVCVDADGNAHLAFKQDHSSGAPDGWLHYGSNASGTWDIDWIVNDDFTLEIADFYQPLALDLSPTGNARIAHNQKAYALGEQFLMYMEQDPYGDWHYTSFGGAPDPSYISLAVSKFDVPHILYRYEDTGALWYATRSVSDLSWSFELVDDSGGNTGYDNSIALDSQGDPHVSYRSGSAQSLRYARRLPGGTWLKETVDDSAPIQSSTSIGLDAYDNIHIAYFNRTDSTLCYAYTRDCNGNGIDDEDDFISGVLTDCDGNGISDECEIALGFAHDCNDNGIPDACDDDCNNNGIADECDIAEGTSNDCTGNGIPDECEIADGASDCNDNGIIDYCDVVYGGAEDCNNNFLPDECDEDCDDNGEVDSCELADGTAINCDSNDSIDACDLLEPGNDCDQNGELDRCQVTSTGSIAYGSEGEFGKTVIAADFNADGHRDIIIAAPEAAGGDGEVYIFLGPDSPVGASPDLILVGESDDALGTALAVGDVNGDLIDDLIVGRPSLGFWSSGAGHVDIHLGGPDPDSVPDMILAMPDPDNGSFGISLATIDVDNDGHDEILVGAEGGSGIFDDPGQVHLYPSNPLQSMPSHSWSGYYGEFFGHSLANAGDLDGNGLDDFIVGVPGYSDGRGSAKIYFTMPGSTFLTGPSIIGHTGDAQLGHAVAGAGDINDDGYADVAVGAPDDVIVWSDHSRIEVHFGGASMDGSPDLLFESEVIGMKIGSAVAGGGDINGDGYPDLLVGAKMSHQAFALFGGPHLDAEPDFVFAGSEDAGAALAFAGDGDGDGVQEILVGAPGHGNDDGEVYLVGLNLPDFGDCNANGVSDRCDISSGTSLDNDGNGVPDECESTGVDEDPLAPLATRMVGVYPNPFNPSTALTFELAEPARVTLAIYDLGGRRIRTLSEGEERGVGRHSVTWDGKNDKGVAASAGVYFYRFLANGSREAGRLVMIK